MSDVSDQIARKLENDHSNPHGGKEWVEEMKERTFPQIFVGEGAHIFKVQGVSNFSMHLKCQCLPRIDTTFLYVEIDKNFRNKPPMQGSLVEIWLAPNRNHKVILTVIDWSEVPGATFTLFMYQESSPGNIKVKSLHVITEENDIMSRWYKYFPCETAPYACPPSPINAGPEWHFV